jgi:hypothetical protein
VVFFALIQFIRIDKSTRTYIKSDDLLIASNASPEVVSIMHQACYDCHSYDTKYPWYSNVAPISWWTKNHINEAREEINFNDWTHFSKKRQDKKMQACIEEVEEGEMPMQSYTWIHREARLSTAQKNILIAYFNSLLSQK